LLSAARSASEETHLDADKLPIAPASRSQQLSANRSGWPQCRAAESGFAHVPRRLNGPQDTGNLAHVCFCQQNLSDFAPSTRLHHAGAQVRHQADQRVYGESNEVFVGWRGAHGLGGFRPWHQRPPYLAIGRSNGSFEWLSAFGTQTERESSV
jgi:hypothetical protein